MDAQFQFQFEWNPRKAKQNSRKHRISFERAATVFLDPRMLNIVDDAHSLDEERWVTLGLDRTGVLLVVCHTFRELTTASAMVRLISARRATREESELY